MSNYPSPPQGADLVYPSLWVIIAAKNYLLSLFPFINSWKDLLQAVSSGVYPPPCSFCGPTFGSEKRGIWWFVGVCGHATTAFVTGEEKQF